MIIDSLVRENATLRAELAAERRSCKDYSNLINRQDKQIAEMELALRDISTQFQEPWSQSRAFRGLQETSHVDQLIRERDSLRAELAAREKEYRLMSDHSERVERELATEKQARAEDTARLDRIMVGGNHLASALINMLGASEDKFPPYTAAMDQVEGAISNPDMRDLWICWRTIMQVRDATRSSTGSQEK